MEYVGIFLAGAAQGFLGSRYIDFKCSMNANPEANISAGFRKSFIRHSLLMAFNGSACVWVVAVMGWTKESLLICGAVSVLLAVAFVDAKTFEIPVECNCLIGFWGILHLFLNLEGWPDYIGGMGLMSGLLLAVYFITNQKGIGGGDVKLMTAAGLMLGWQKISLALLLGCSLGLIMHSLRMWIWGKGKVLALGPYLSVGIFVSMLYGDKILANVL